MAAREIRAGMWALAAAVGMVPLGAGCAASDTNAGVDPGDSGGGRPVLAGDAAPFGQDAGGGAVDSGVGSTLDSAATSSDAASPVDSASGDEHGQGACASGPQTALHYAAGWSGNAPGSTLGFNLADVSSASAASALPAGTLGLVWLGLCNGADSTFVSTVTPFVANAKVYAFYLMDEPDPTGQYAPTCTAANLKAESDWIHANATGTKTFIVMMNMGSDSAPSYDNTYNPTNTGIDLYGLDPYPCQPANNGCDLTEIASSVAAAKKTGIPEVAIVPVYQAFGGGGYAAWTLPTAAQAQTILTAWASVTPKPLFDYVYAWGSQQNDTALGQSSDLQTVFGAHNLSTCLKGADQ